MSNISDATDEILANHFDEFMEMCEDKRRWKTIDADIKDELLDMLFDDIIYRDGKEENLFEACDDQILNF
jgi:hypothetical protein